MRRNSPWRVVLAAAAVTAFVGTTTSTPTTATSPLGEPEVADAVQPLAFDLPSIEQLRSSDKKVYAHYFPLYPISIDNAPPDQDYYALEYLLPEGEGGRHVAYGGFQRQRALPRDPLDDPEWAVADMRTEVERAISAGLDGFVFNMLDIDGPYFTRLNRLLTAAAEVDPDFDVVLMPDVDVDPAALAAAIATVADHPSVARGRDGRLIVSPFAAERQGVDWWSGWLELMNSTYGVQIAFVPLLVDYYGHVDAFAPVSAGLSHWGSRSPTLNADVLAYGSDAAARGRLWMQPVSVQDMRPRAGLFYEAGNTENLRLTWQAAIDGDADWVQLVTWNDYSEHSAFAPSTGTRWVPLDLSAYYLSWFKTGVAPTIVRDAAYVSHRTHPVGAMPIGGQTELMTVRPEGSEVRDTVEVVLLLTAPVDVVVEIGAERHEFRAEAGLTTHLFPLAIGTVSVRLVYSADLEIAVVSPDEVTDQPVVQDLLYHMVGSARDGDFRGFAPPSTTAPSTTSAPASPSTAGPQASAESAEIAESPSSSSSSSGPSPSATGEIAASGPEDDGTSAGVVGGMVAASAVVIGGIWLAMHRRSRRLRRRSRREP